MSTTTQRKRKATTSSGASAKSKKRQKHNGAPSPTSLPAEPRAARAIPLGKLNWKEVAIPDVLDDYEGFFGLEEVDEVEVIKEGNIVSYKARETKQEDGHNAQVENGPPSSADEGDLDDAESWDGFSGDEASATPQKLKTSQLLEDEQLETQEDEDEDEEEEEADYSHDVSDGSLEAELDEELEDVSFSHLKEEDLTMGASIAEWTDLGLPEEVLTALSRLNFTKPTPIQRAAIPEINAGFDVVGKAATGSGKTLAYGIPVLQTFMQRKREGQVTPADEKHPLAIILAPTRELAHQISSHLTALYSDDIVQGPRIATVTGGLAVQKQQRLLAKADIIIGTPGRLWDVISSSTGLIDWLKRIRFLVIDEADRLLSEGHYKELDEILSALDRTKETVGEAGGAGDSSSDDEEAEEAADRLAKAHRQTLVFSATFSQDLQHKLTSKPKRWQAPSAESTMTTQESLTYLLSKLRFRTHGADGTPITPKIVDVDPVSAMAPGLREALLECPTPTEKDLYLYALLLLHPRVRTLVFANSISAVKRLVPYLQNLQLPAQALHSHMAQKARLRAVERFGSDAFKIPGRPNEKDNKKPKAANGTTPTQPQSAKGILVCTDIASRGLDIPSVDLVIHYHLPRTADSYVHRSGRTARAGAKGASVLICAPGEVAGMRRLVGKVHAERAARGRKRALRAVELDHRVVTRVRGRAALAKRIADVEAARAGASAAAVEGEGAAAKPRGRETTSSLLRRAAEDLGVEYDSDELDAAPVGRHGRGNARRAQKRADKEVGKGEVSAWKRELRELLSKRVNVGVSETYVAKGDLDVKELLEGGGMWIGAVKGVGLDLNRDL